MHIMLIKIDYIVILTILLNQKASEQNNRE
jgi:hypothetical protein